MHDFEIQNVTLIAAIVTWREQERVCHATLEPVSLSICHSKLDLESLEIPAK